MEDRTDQEHSKANMNSLMNSLSSVRIRGGAFPLLTIDLDASVNLDLSFNHHLSNEGIIAIARGCPRLEKMRCDWCDWLTYEAFLTVSEIIPRFYSLGW